jgi:hypothetical protein
MKLKSNTIVQRLELLDLNLAYGIDVKEVEGCLGYLQLMGLKLFS